MAQVAAHDVASNALAIPVSHRTLSYERCFVCPSQKPRLNLVIGR